MKAILISDHAKWCALMMNGDKTVEVRKSTALYKAIQKLIEEYGYADIYVYCTKGKSLIYTDGTDGKGDYVDYKYYESYKGDKNDIGSGKVIFKFRCYKVEEIENEMWADYEHDEYMPRTKTCDWDMLEYKSCVDLYDIRDYLDGDTGCAIHISNLEIFNKPKELSEFEHYNLTKKSYRRFPYCDFNLTKAPQSWCYVEVGE